MTKAAMAGCVVCLCAGVPAAGAAEGAPTSLYVVVFDFHTAGAPDAGKADTPPPKRTLGVQLADSVRLRLRRHKEYTVIDRLTTLEFAKALPFETEPKTVADLIDNKLAAHVGVYGTVGEEAGGVRVRVRCVDHSQPKKPAVWTRTFTADSERARGLLAQNIVEAIRARGEWRPPEYGDQTEPDKFGEPLNANGGFENGHDGWDAPDRASTFIEAAPAGRGNLLRIQTDLERDKWLAYQRQLRFGQTDPNHAPRLEKDTSYGSVAGLEGVHYRSVRLKATPGQRYWLTADMKGRTQGIFFPKIFVKGFSPTPHAMDGLPEASLVALKMTARQFAALAPGEREKLVAADAEKHPERYCREVYRWYLACRNEEDVWKHYAAPCPPRGGLPEGVEWLQIQVYAYWPPGRFLFDNVNLYADPRQKAPLPEAEPRTPNFGRTSDVVEAETHRPPATQPATQP